MVFRLMLRNGMGLGQPGGMLAGGSLLYGSSLRAAKAGRLMRAASRAVVFMGPLVVVYYRIAGKWQGGLPKQRAYYRRSPKVSDRARC